MTTLGAQVDTLQGAEVKAREAASCGNYWTAAQIFEKQNLQKSTVSARFNLATAYARTGRYEEATTLYKTVVADGQYTRLTTDPDPANPNAPLRRFTASDEAALRLTEIEGARSIQQLALGAAAVSATDQGTNVSATVGSDTAPVVVATIDEGHIADAQALAMDGIR